MRSCNGFTCVYSTACASRFRFSSVLGPLGNAQVQGEHQDNSTKHDGRILHKTRTRYPQVECSKHPQVVVFGAVQEPTQLVVSTRIVTRERQTATRTRGRPQQTQQIRVLPDTTDTMRVPMQPTDDNRAKYSRSLVNTIDEEQRFFPIPHMQIPVALQDTQIRTRFAHAQMPKIQSQEK